jgi:hypothetical protein
MAYLLFPGRHLVNTKFQENYLREVLTGTIDKLPLIGKSAVPANERITGIVFAVTSANQAHSRYNPIPFYERTISLDRFARQFKKDDGMSYRIIGIPHFDPTGRFADYTLKEILEQTDGKLDLKPQNTIVLCSTPSLIEQYSQLGFAILSAEYDEKTKGFTARTPIEIIKMVAEAGNSWESKIELRTELSQATLETWHDFPDIPENILRLWRDPLLTESGSLTLDRNYSSYAYGMSNDALMDVKYRDIRGAIRPGKIVDEGCADGALIVRLARDFPDSDIVGIELTTEFTARCEERLRAGEFGGTYVHFHQRNLLDSIFEDGTIDTTICNSTTHELYSYAGQEITLRDYLKKKYLQTARSGRIVIRDVVGPNGKDEEVYMNLSVDDGFGSDVFKTCSNRESLKKHLETLSTHARFLRFAEDYLADMRKSGKRSEDTKIHFREEKFDGETYIILRYKDAVEFMTKKDYVDNWRSELNEEFAFWDFPQWKDELKQVGFSVLENPNSPEGSSRAYTSDWVVENRWKGKVALFKKIGDKILPIPYPATNMVLVAEKL